MATAPSYRAARARPIPAVLVAVVLILGAWPLLISVPAPLQDWPNHLARVHIIDTLLRGDAEWAPFYRLNFALVPNVALDVGVLAGIRAGLSDAAAGQAFLLLTYAVFVGGFCALARRFGPLGLARVAAGVALFYTPPLFWGLVNYVFALGVGMGLLAAWLGAGARSRFAVAALGTALLFFCHLIAAGAFVITIGCCELAELHRDGRAWRSRWSSILALATLMTLFAAAPADPLHEIAWNGTASLWAFVRWKIIIFLQNGINGATWPVRYVTWFGALIALIAAVVARPRPRVALGVLAGAMVVALLAIAAPQRIGSGSLLDDRLALVPILLLAATVRPGFRNPRLGRIAGGVLIATAVARIVALMLVWRGPAAEFRDYDAAIGRLPRGTMLVMARGRPIDAVTWPLFWANPYTSIEAQGVAHGAFVPMIFANIAQQPLVLDSRYEGIKQPLDLSDPLLQAQSLDRVRAMCAGNPVAVPGVAITVLYSPPGRRFTDAAGRSVELYRGRRVVVLDGCAMAAR